MSSVWETIKYILFRDVKSGKTQINDTESFGKYADNTIKSIKSLYLPERDVFKESDDIKYVPKIAGTLEVHKYVRELNNDNVCKLNFFKLTTDEKPFYQQQYRRPGDPEVWYQSILSLMHGPDNTCTSSR